MNSALHNREAPPAWIGSQRHFEWLRGIVMAVVVLNVFDAAMTIGWITSGLAEEANPLLADLAHTQPVLFTLVKTVLVGLGCVLLWRLRRRPSAVIGIFIGFMAYYLLALYHLQALRLNLAHYLF